MEAVLGNYMIGTLHDNSLSGNPPWELSRWSPSMGTLSLETNEASLSLSVGLADCLVPHTPLSLGAARHADSLGASLAVHNLGCCPWKLSDWNSPWKSSLVTLPLETLPGNPSWGNL